MGLNSLFSSSVSMINNITGLGLNFSAVRDISIAKESGDNDKLSVIVKIFRRWLIFTALTGFLAVIFLSPLLSRYTFGESKYTLSFIMLSFMVLFGTLSAGNASLLRGIRDLKGFAVHTLASSFIGLLVSLPLYYFFGLKAIVPALILSSFVTFIFSAYYVSGIKLNPVKMSIRESYTGGLDMVKLGVAMMATTSINSLVHYLINIFISNYGSVSDLGMYHAAMNITNQSIGMIFAALIIDYQPRLAAVSGNNTKVRKMVNHQAEITLLISAPVLLALIIASPLIIRVLLSKEFIFIADLIRLLAFAMLFKTVSFSIGAVSFAKGDKKVFFLLEGLYTNISFLLFSTVGYALMGLKGVGYGFICMHIIYLAVVLVVNKRLYNYAMSRDLIKIVTVQLGFVTVAMLLLLVLHNSISYYISGAALLFSSWYSYIHLDKRIEIKRFVMRILNKGNSTLKEEKDEME